MTFIDGNTVTVQEIATFTKSKVADVEAEARSLGLFVGSDWAGRAALSTSDARLVVSGDGRRAREADAEWQEHLRDCEDWARARDGVVSAARRDRVDDLQRRGRGGPEVASAAGEAAQAAGRAFELSTPPPQWRGEPDGNARRLYTDDDQPGLLTRIADRVMESVR